MVVAIHVAVAILGALVASVPQEDPHDVGVATELLDAASQRSVLSDDGEAACLRKAQNDNIYTEAALRWAKQRASEKSKSGFAHQVAFKMDALRDSAHARHTLQDMCSSDYYRRAIYRHEARFLVARAVLRGRRTLTKKKGKLMLYTARMKCEHKMLAAVRPLWREGGSKLAFHPNRCKRMREAWAAKLEIAAQAYRGIATDPKCDRLLWRGNLNRAQYMAEGINVICKGHFHKDVLGRKQAASLRVKIAQYATEALASHGNERYQNSAELLARDPVYKAAQAYLRRREKDYNAVANLSDKEAEKL